MIAKKVQMRTLRLTTFTKTKDRLKSGQAMTGCYGPGGGIDWHKMVY